MNGNPTPSSSSSPPAQGDSARLADALLVMLSEGLTLREWRASGLLAREWPILRALSASYGRLVLVACDREPEEATTTLLQREAVESGTPVPEFVRNDQQQPPEAYAAALPARVAGALLTGPRVRSAVLVTTQISGGAALIRIAHRLRSDGIRTGVVARGGFLPSKLAMLEDGPSSDRAVRAAHAEGMLFRAADAIVAGSSRMVEDIAWRYHADPSRLSLVPCFVPTDPDAAESHERERGRILFAGRLQSSKRVDLLISALAELPDPLRNHVSLEVLGDGPELSRLRALASALGVAVHFETELTYAQVRQRLARCSLYAQASVAEGHPMTVLEAMGTGAAVIVADTPGLGDVVRQGVTGIKVAPDAGSFAHAIAELLGDDDWRDMLGQAAAAEIRRSLSLDHVVPQELRAHAAALARASTMAPASLAWVESSRGAGELGELHPVASLERIIPRDVDGRDATPALSHVRLLVLDFDGVLTDNRVLVMQDGTEGVLCSRGDGMGLTTLRDRGLPILVLSKERNPVVSARCAKLKIECRQGIDDKLPELQRIAAERGLTRQQIAYVGNDINDLGPLSWVGVPIVVADAHQDVLPLARLITSKPGGHGAVREVCDWLLPLVDTAVANSTPRTLARPAV